MGLRGYVTEQSCMNVSDVCADAIIWNLQQNYFAHALSFVKDSRQPAAKSNLYKSRKTNARTNVSRTNQRRSSPT